MLRYEWNNHSNSPPPNLILSEMDLHHHHHQQQHHHNNHHHNHHHDFSSIPSSSNPHRPIFEDPFSTPCTFPHDNTNPPQLPFFANSFTTPNNNPSSSITLDSFSSVMHTPKMEPDHVFTNRPIGLNLGRRTYFSADDDLVSRLYHRSRAMEPTVHSPRCQAEGCNADLSHAKHYHRRHKVCEFHSKASTVIAAGLTQRFCQQCSRFHLLSEFDNGKRSCRKRLADHNRRRRKSNNQRITPTASASLSSENAQTSPSQNIIRSPSDSGMNSSSSVTIAVSPPRVSFDSSFMQRSYD